MAEEQAGTPGRSWLSTIIVFVAVGLFAAVFATLTYFFFIGPYLLASAEGAAPVVEVDDDILPLEAVSMEFPEMQATVLTDDPAEAAPVLVFQVSLVCDQPLTMEQITARQSMFTAMIQKTHRNRRRAELNDPTQQEAFLRSIEQEANGLLKRMAPDAPGRVLEAMYLKYAVFDL